MGPMDVELATKLVEFVDNLDDFLVIGIFGVVRIVDNSCCMNWFS